jgi:hypothetical protein
LSRDVSSIARGRVNSRLTDRTHCHAGSLPTKSADVVPASAAVVRKSLWPGLKADVFRRAVSKPVVASRSRNFPSLAEAKQGSTVRESLHAAIPLRSRRLRIRLSL